MVLRFRFFYIYSEVHEQNQTFIECSFSTMTHTRTTEPGCPLPQSACDTPMGQ